MTGLMSTVIAVYIKKRNGIDDQWCGNFLLSIAAIQIVEFFAWIIIKHKNYNKSKTLKKFNKLLALIAVPLVLASQPLVAYYGAMKNNYVSKDYFIYYIFFSIIIIIFMLTRRKSNYISKQKNRNKTMFNEGYHLNCGVNLSKVKNILFLVYSIIVLYPFTKRIDQKYIQFMFLIFFLTKFVFSKSASRWCLYSNLISIIFLFKKATI